ncbi:hypothetical protein SprV_0401574600 [Sparganum proliferum]
MLRDAYSEDLLGINTVYRLDEKLIKHPWPIVRGYLCTRHDDGSGHAKSIDLLAPDYANFGLTINTEEREVIHQLTPDKDYREANIIVNGAYHTFVDQLECLGSTISGNIGMDDEVSHQISKANQAFGLLQASVWNHRGLHLNAKFKMSFAVVLMTIFYRDGDMDSLRQLGQLSLQSAKAEATGQDFGCGSPGTDQICQHPCHAKASANALEESPRKDGGRVQTSPWVLVNKEGKSDAKMTPDGPLSRIRK